MQVYYEAHIELSCPIKNEIRQLPKSHHSITSKQLITILSSLRMLTYLRVDGTQMHLRHPQIEPLHGNVLLQLVGLVV